MSHNISQSLLREFDHEMATSRKFIERVPEGKGEFAPHKKSMTLSKLAGHLCEIPTWGVMTLAQDELDLNPSSGPTYQPFLFTSRAAALATFDREMKKAREALANTSDAQMMTTWTLKSGGHVVLAMPKVAVFRSFVMNHMIHHRAQLGVYLRMNDVALPSSYGPTADGEM